MALRPLIRLFALLGLPTLGCGGAATAEGDAKSPESSPSEEGSWESGPGEPEAPRGPDCSDGTCFSCGDGICPKGAYCDASASGGPACAWLPECSGTPTCACITKVLGSCTCEEASGPTASCP